ncbi:hypothetical protein Q4603_02195 [Zobellia galactanivorans]|uniref:hypothetical protein n=1 Tax=Zobellia TaxID=112040 RepID=UPI000B532612|nr:MULTISPECIES: hypothetical protein [Zobellia]MBU3026129.1 hypothetical protein [Zobellia galactanivorans]MDO6807395.1 hypothetical protein [Zobellia galactanivorans]OWW27215.1 hypothetical protein B4Q04_05985 [Zobellia sp. OII3]
MIKYYVNNTRQSNGNYEVHKHDCNLLAFILSKTDLGFHPTCQGAVMEAGKMYKKTSACIRCCKECHN